MSVLPAAYTGTARFTGRDFFRSIPLWPRDVTLALLFAYRKVISPMYGEVCKYYPSCSAYGVGAVQQHGAVKGMALAVWRILRCNPWSLGGVDDVHPHKHFHYGLTARGFVVPSPAERTAS